MKANSQIYYKIIHFDKIKLNNKTNFNLQYLNNYKTKNIIIKAVVISIHDLNGDELKSQSKYYVFKVSLKA